VHGVQRVERAATVDAGVQVAPGRAHEEVELDDPAQADGDRRRPLVDHPRVEDDRAVGPALVGAHPVGHRCAAGLLLALDQHADVHRERAGGGELARDVQQRQEVALVVGGAARVHAPVAHVGLEWRRDPGAGVAGRLHVVVAVDEHRRCVGARGAQLTDGEWVARRAHDPRVATRAPDPLHDPGRRPLEVGGIAVTRRDRRDAQPCQEVVEESLVHGAPP
jgi:hypothetical protein